MTLKRTMALKCQTGTSYQGPSAADQTLPNHITLPQSPLHKCTLQDFLGSLGEKAPEHNLPAELLQDLFKSIQQEALEGSV